MADKANGQEPVKPLSEEELSSVLESDLNHSTFVFGENPDKSPRTWKMVPLPWKFEKQFRKHAMPMLATSYKPFETLMGIISQKFYSDVTPSFIESVVSSETAMDDYMERCVHVILMSQDKNITLEWVEKNATSRDQMFSIITRQADLHKLLDRLGESLAERFVKLAGSLGIANLDLPTLKQLWKQRVGSFSAQLTKILGIEVKRSGPFMESISSTGHPSSTSLEENEQSEQTTPSKDLASASKPVIPLT